MEVETKDEDGYKFTYYAHRNDSAKKPIFWRRKDFPDVVYRTEEAKLRAITQEIIHYHILGRPQLVGTTSVEHSERLSDRLRAEPVRRLMQTMLLRDLLAREEQPRGRRTRHPELQPLNAPLESLNAGDLRQMARTLDDLAQPGRARKPGPPDQPAPDLPGADATAWSARAAGRHPAPGAECPQA